MKVSVVLITYNHEKHVRRAIESVLMQKTDFEYELLISEDCSSDATREILHEFQTRYPDRIQLLLSPNNLRTNEVFTRAAMVARGDYIATLDGDDYWTSPHKLQRQVDFMSDHPKCSMCFHNVFRVWEDDSANPKFYHEQPVPAVTHLPDILRGNYVPSCSAMIRRHIIAKLPEWYVRAAFGDWPLYIIAAQHGSIGYLDEIMAVYRIHRGGAWSGLTELDQIKSRLTFYRQLRNTEKQLSAELRRASAHVADDLRQLMIRHAGRREWKVALRAAALFARSFPRQLLRECRTALMPSYRPYLYRRYPAPRRLLRTLRERVQANRAGRAASYEGNLEVVDGTIITGWVWNRAQPNSTVNVVIWDGDVALAVVPADRYRRDLAEAGKGDGYHAFVYWADAPPTSNGIRVTVAGQEWLIPGNPLNQRASTETGIAVRVSRSEYRRIVLAYRFCGLGGVETALLNRSAALRRQGIEPTVLFGQFYGTGASAFAALPHVHVGLSARETGDLLDQAFDAVVIVDYPELLEVAEARAHQSLLLLETHSAVAVTLTSFCRVAARSSVAGIIVPSRFNERQLRTVCGECRPIHIVPNAIDTEIFVPQSSAALRARFGRLMDKIIILWIGRLEDVKDPQSFLAIANELRARRNDLHFLLVGDAPQDAEYQSRLRRLIADDARGDFTFTPAVPYREMPLVYALAAATGGCLVSASRFESVPMVFVEAMACECPVIASAVGGVREIVEDGVTGGLFELGDHGHAVEEITRVLPMAGNNDHRDRIVRTARERVIANHSLDAIGQHFLTTLRTIEKEFASDSMNLSHAVGHGARFEVIAPNH